MTTDVTAHENIDVDNLPAELSESDLEKLSRGNDFTSTDDDEQPGKGAAAPAGGGGEDTTAGGDGDDTVAAGDKDDGIRIPKGRLDEVVRKARERERADQERVDALQREIRELNARAARAAKPEDKFDVPKAQARMKELIAAHSVAVIDGHAKEATAAMEEMTALSAKIAEETTAQSSAAARFQAAEEIRIEMVLDALEAKHPELKQGDEKFDEELSKAVYEEAVNIQAGRRVPFSKALQLAAPKVFAARELEALRAEVETLKKGGTKPETEVDEAGKRKTNVEKNVKVSGKQPPATGAAGADHDKGGERPQNVKVSSISPEEYDALPEATKARLRGDHHVAS